MKLKRILSGLTAVVLAVSAMAVTSFTSSVSAATDYYAYVCFSDSTEGVAHWEYELTNAKNKGTFTPTMPNIDGNGAYTAKIEFPTSSGTLNYLGLKIPSIKTAFSGFALAVDSIYFGTTNVGPKSAVVTKTSTSDFEITIHQPASWGAPNDVISSTDISTVTEVTVNFTVSGMGYDKAGDEEPVDTAELEALLADIDDMDETLYTEESWNALMTYVNAIDLSGEETQGEIDAIVADIEALIDALVLIDEPPVGVVLTEIEKIKYDYTVSGYVEDTTVQFSAANLNWNGPDKQEIAITGDGDDALEFTFDSPATGFKNMGYFETIEDSPLVVTVTKVTINDEYVFDYEQALEICDSDKNGLPNIWWKEPFEDGDKIMENDDAYLDFYYEDAISFYTQLVEPSDELATKDEIDAAKALLETAKALAEADYTAESYADLEEAIAALEAYLAGDDIFKAELADLVKAVEEAMDALVPLPATDDEIAAAKALLETAKAIDSTKYTDASYAPLKTAIDALEAYLAGDVITKAELAKLVKAVEDAIAGLKEKTTTGTTVTPSRTTVTPSKTTTTVKVPTVAKVKKLKAKSAKKKTLKVTWKKVNGANGYKVQVSAKKTFKKKVFKKTINKNAKKLVVKGKKIKSGKKYFVRVKAYKTYTGANGKTLKAWGKWAKTKKAVKVK